MCERTQFESFEPRVSSVQCSHFLPGALIGSIQQSLTYRGQREPRKSAYNGAFFLLLLCPGDLPTRLCFSSAVGYTTIRDDCWLGLCVTVTVVAAITIVSWLDSSARSIAGRRKTVNPCNNPSLCLHTGFRSGTDCWHTCSIQREMCVWKEQLIRFRLGIARAWDMH